VNGSAIALGALCVVAALAPTLPTELGVLVLLGAASIVYASSTNAALQLAVAPAMRGRVMALYAVVFLGSTPIGSPLTGWFAGVEGPRWAFAAGGLAAALAGTAAALASRRRSAAAAARAGTGPAPRPEAA
jgi:MFS family permease